MCPILNYRLWPLSNFPEILQHCHFSVCLAELCSTFCHFQIFLCSQCRFFNCGTSPPKFQKLWWFFFLLESFKFWATQLSTWLQLYYNLYNLLFLLDISPSILSSVLVLIFTFYFLSTDFLNSHVFLLPLPYSSIGFFFPICWKFKASACNSAAFFCFLVSKFVHCSALPLGLT